MTSYKEALEEKASAYRAYCQATQAYVVSQRSGTENSETYNSYQKAQDRFKAAFNRVEKLKKKNEQRINNVK